MQNKLLKIRRIDCELSVAEKLKSTLIKKATITLENDKLEWVISTPSRRDLSRKDAETTQD